jgi:hypothetical protein
MEIRTDRVGLLLDQLTQGVELNRERIGSPSAEAFLWEPVPGAWSIRRREENRTPDAMGPGEYVLEFERSGSPFGAGHLTTMAWRVGHLVSGFAGRYEWTFGGRSADPAGLVDFSPDPDVMFGRLWTEVDRWVAGIEALSDDELDQVGFGQYPWGLDPQLPFIGIVWWVNRETIHHLAEVSLLLDLFEQRP